VKKGLLGTTGQIVVVYLPHWLCRVMCYAWEHTLVAGRLTPLPSLCLELITGSHCKDSLLRS